METAARQLFQVVKDHNNDSIQEMLNISNVYCYEQVDESTDEEGSEEQEITPTHFPLCPCSLVVVNQREYAQPIYEAVEKLRSDGLVIDVDVSRDDSFLPSTEMGCNEVAAVIKKVEKAMKLCDHALFRSQVYAKPQGAKFTYVRMMDVTSYLHKLLSNDYLKDSIMKHFQMLEKFIGHPACEVIEQLQFDVDLIEVANGFCFSIRNRRFIPCPIAESMCGKMSPRAFVPYDCSTPPDPGYFRQAILNSFEDPTIRVNFLNKFYQCLVAYRMPHKVRKLVVAGPRDSGKTCWANVFHRVVPAESIATITKEHQFSAAMLTDDTQLVIVDEWSAHTMQSDLAKTILQGGWMITAVKHAQPRRVMNNSPYYITTNHLPDFGDENDNVQRRIQVFTTTSLPSTTPNADRWIYDNAMDCIVWITEELERHHHHIANDELWYEENVSETLMMEGGPSLFHVRYVRDMCPADFRDEATCETESTPTIHERFVLESRVQRLQRRRRRQGSLVQADEDDSDDEYIRASDPQIPPAKNGGQIESSDSPPMDEVNFNVSPSTSTVVNAAERANHAPAHETSPKQIENEPPIEDDPPVEDEPPMEDVPPMEDEAPMEDEPPPEENTQATPEHDEEPHTSRADDGEQMDSFEIRLYSPSKSWVLNSVNYMAKVASLIKSNFMRNLQKSHLHSFAERRRKAELKKTKKDQDFWTQPDPAIDAWMLVTGRKREVFDISAFVKQHRDIVKELERVRKVVNVLVLSSRCPVIKALEELERQERGEEPAEEQLEVPSQTYWTTIKNWRPW
jgi:hypothetical protein